MARFGPLEEGFQQDVAEIGPLPGPNYCNNWNEDPERLIATFAGDLPSHTPAHFSYLRGGWRHPSKSERYEMSFIPGNGIFYGEVKVSKFSSYGAKVGLGHLLLGKL